MEASENFYVEQLESGVQVVGQPMDGVQSAAIGILVGTGARDERPEQSGISHFTEQLLFRGTEHLDARQLSDRFDALGISRDSSAGLEMTVVTSSLIGDRMPAAIDLLADVLRYPSFPPDSVDSVRTLILQEIRQREDRPAQKVMELLRQRFFAGSPLGNDVLGSPETLGALRRDDLVAYWTDRYTANNMIVSVAGRLEWEAVADQLRRGETPESVLSILLAGRAFYDYCGGTDAGFVAQIIGDIGHHEAKGQEVSRLFRRLQTENRRDLVYSLLLRYPQNWEPGPSGSGRDNYDYRGHDWRYRR